MIKGGISGWRTCTNVCVLHFNEVEHEGKNERGVIFVAEPVFAVKIILLDSVC